MAVSAEKLKKAMLDNLEARGAVECIYTDKVDEYINLWRVCRLLEKDIASRGVVVFDEKAQKWVDNTSVKQLVGVGKQMLSIYTALGFKDQMKLASVARDDDDL